MKKTYETPYIEITDFEQRDNVLLYTSEIHVNEDDPVYIDADQGLEEN